MQIDETKLQIRKLQETDLEFLKDFTTYESELKKFICEDAYSNQNIGISITYLLIYEGNLIGYIAILSDSLNLDADLKETFRQKGITYKTLPALKIGRLAIDSRYLKNGFGTKLLEFAYSLAKYTSKHIFGCRFLIVDAKRNIDPKKDSIHFYKKFGFQPLKERIKGTLPLYLDIYLKDR